MARSIAYERVLDAKILWGDENSDIRSKRGEPLKIKQEPEDAVVENDETEMVDERPCVSSVHNNKTIKFQANGDSMKAPGTSHTKSDPKLISKIHDSLTNTDDNCNTVGKKRKRVSSEEPVTHGASNAEKRFKPKESKLLKNSSSSSKFQKVRKSVKFRLISTNNHLKTRMKRDITNKTATSLRKGVNESRNNVIHKCEDCGMSFRNAKTLRVHLSYYSASGSFQCDLCNASFSKNELLLKHVKRAHSVTPNGTLSKHKCTFCTACFSVKNSLIQHILHSHKKPIADSDDSIEEGTRDNSLSEKLQIQKNNRNNGSQKNTDNVATTLNNIRQIDADDAKYKTSKVKQDKKNRESRLGNRHFDGSAGKSTHSSPVILADTDNKEPIVDTPNMEPSALKVSRKTRIVEKTTRKKVLTREYENDETKSPKMRSMPLRRTRSRSFKDEQLESVLMNKENIKNSTSEGNKASVSNPCESSSRSVSLETPSSKPDDDRNDSNTLMLPLKKTTTRGNRSPKENSGKDKVENVCGYCAKSFHESSCLGSNCRWKNVKPKPINCILCDQAFSHELDLIDHYISIHLKSVSGIIECCVCHVPVFGIAKMKAHLSNHHRRLEKQHIKKFCRKCNRNIGILCLRKYCFKCKPLRYPETSKVGSHDIQDKQQLSDSSPLVPVLNDNTRTCSSLRFNENVKCTDCVRVFQDDDQLKNHQCIPHSTLKCTEQNKARDILKVTHVRTVRRIKPIRKLTCNKNVRLKSSSRNEEIVKSEKHCKHDKQCVRRSLIGKRSELLARVTNNLLSKHRRKPRQFYDNKCNVCGLNCCCINSLKLHEKRYSIWGKNTCNICGLRFALKTMLLTHMKSAHNPKILPFHRVRCEICKQGFYNKKFLRIHLSHFHNIKYYQCQICKLRFDNAKRLDKHMRYYSKTLGPRSICNACGETFECKYMLRYHQTQAHDVKKLKSFKHCCDICNCTFPDELLLQAHIGHFHTAREIKVDALMKTEQNSSNPLSDRIFEVNKFVLKFQDSSDNQDMIKGNEKCENKIIDESTPATTWTHTLPEYKCTTCKMSFYDPYDLLNHEWEFSNEGKEECDVCERKFVKSHHLMTHKLKHTRDDNEMIYEHECNICHEDFTSLEQLKIHGLHLHGPQFSWKKESETTANVLNNPKTINGEGVVLFFRKIGLNRKVPAKLSSSRCDYCKQIFNDDISLDVHMRKHAYQAYYTNSSKYLCLICKHKFRTNDVLRAHVIHDHTFDWKDSNSTEPSTEPETDCSKNSHNVSTEPNDHSDGTSHHISAIVDYAENQKTNPNSQLCQDGQTKKQAIDSDVQSDSLLSLKGESQYVIYSESIECDICLEKFDTQQSLKNHDKSCLLRDRLKCTMCNAEFLSKNSVLLHERRIHGGESRGKPAQSSGNENSIEETENALVLPTKLSIDQQLLKIGRVRVKPPPDTSLISKNKEKYHRNEGRQRRVKYLKKREGDLLEEFNVSIANNDSIIQGEGNGRPHQILVDKIGTENQFTNNRQNKTTEQKKKSGPSARDLRPGNSIPRIGLLKKNTENRKTGEHLAITSEDSMCVQPSSTTTLSKDEKSKKSRKRGKANPPESSVDQLSLQPALNSADYNLGSRVKNTTIKVVQTSNQVLPSGRNFFDENQKQLTSIKPSVGCSAVVSEQQTVHLNPKISNTNDAKIKNTNLVKLFPNIDTKVSGTDDYSITYSSYRIEVSPNTDKISNSNILCQSATVSSSSNNSEQNGEASGTTLPQSLNHEDAPSSKTHTWKFVSAVCCSYCKLLFSERIKLVEHMKSHRSENQASTGGLSLSDKDVVSKRTNEQKCSVCKKCKVSFFPRSADTPSPETDKYCSDCRTVSPLPVKKMKNRSGLRSMTCSLCMKPFNSVTEVMNHFKLEHLKFVCGICDFRSLGEKLLLTHMRHHTANRSTIEPIPCNTCKKYFLGVSDLAKHESSHS